MRFFRASFGALFLLNLAIFRGVGATTVEPMDLDGVGRRAEVVVYGRVAKVDVGANLWRTASVEIVEQVRGKDIASPIAVRLLQRASENERWVERVADAVELLTGEEVLLFLNWAPKLNAWVPVGLKHGKYRVVTDSHGVRRALSWKDASINQVSDVELLKSSSLSSKLSSVTHAPATAALANDEMQKVPSLSSVINHVRGLAP